MNILVIGEINLDCVSRLNNQKLKGEFSIGGKGYNIACNLKYFNLNVDFYTKIGVDGLGNYLIKECENKGINVFYDFLKRKTNCSVALHVGNNLEYDNFYKQETWNRLNLPNKKYDKIIISVLLSSNDLKKIFNKYNSAKFYLSINSTNFDSYYLKYLNKFEFIFCNYNEAKAFIKNKKKITISKIFNHLGVNFIITKDRDGVFLKNNNEIKNVKSIINQKMIKSVYGAGDCFISSFLYYYWCNINIYNAAQKSIKHTHVVLKTYRSNLL